MTVSDAYKPKAAPENVGHIPVLKNEVLALFAPLYPGRFLDMTFGGGGHTSAILDGHSSNVVVGIDCDPEAAPRAKKVAEKYGKRFSFVASYFDELDGKVDGNFDGVLMDLGVSSFQFDTPERGFSFRADAPLDMRMNPTQGKAAWEILETADEETLISIVRDLAEDLRWRGVVKKILAARGTGALRTTKGLVDTLFPHTTGQRIHPATRLFMGLRIAVNRESQRLVKALPQAYAHLNDGGVLAVISFHSGEDREVKNFVQAVTRPRQTAPAVSLIKKIQEPTAAECAANPRARSAKLRAIAKKPLRENSKEAKL